jgi:hexosaminidase
MRLDGSQPAQGPRPVYNVYVGDMCWLWHGASPDRTEHVAMTVERTAWRFGDDAEAAVVRPTAGAAGEFEIHADSCTGPLLASLPLAPAVRESGQHELKARVSTPIPNDSRDLCIFATGDPRDGQWALAQVAFSN